MSDAAAITEAQNALDSAISDYMRQVYESGVVIDWYLIAEIIDGESASREIKVAVSPTMTGWKRDGLLRWVARALGIVTS